MRRRDRYDVSNLPEGQFQSGSKGKVLRNKLGIVSKTEMDRVEALALEKAMDVFLRTFGKRHRFKSSDICRMHREWLGDIYEWAGQYRAVNMSKGGFPFAGAAQIPKLMGELEKGPLKSGTPCLFKDESRVIESLAEVHAELVLIHPFREGNGRLARVVSGLMALQAGKVLSFGRITGGKKKEYFAAVRAGLDRNYMPMGEIFRTLLKG
jgi:cell filamentation protein